MTRNAALIQLTELELPEADRRTALRAFARENGWHPSDEIVTHGDALQFVTGHLVVEHGLDNTAVITFLRRASTFSTLTPELQRSLVSLSYNNLVDWHLFPDADGVLRVFNRAKPLSTHYVSLRDQPDALRAETFDRLVGRKPTPNVPALDEALINTVARWRRLLASAATLSTNTVPIAELFNAIFFVRALEDDQRRRNPNGRRVLPELLQANEALSLQQLITEALRKLTTDQPPDDLLNISMLSAFNGLDWESRFSLVSDFYENRFAPYAYDFSVMSKHALSRIYERYISVLRPRPVTQPLLFGPSESVSETPRRDLGEIYTPQYIARFFARFLQDARTPSQFRSLNTLDPACGSGMFLRTLLESQCDPLTNRDLSTAVEQAFSGAHGIDIEENAAKATKLSLALLYIVLTGHFPERPLDIVSDNALFRLTQSSEAGKYDVVIANPPYVRWESIPESWHDAIRSILSDCSSPRPDLYLAFLRLSLNLINPKGMLLFVLPHAFLMSDSARSVREKLSDGFWIRHLVDLSTLDVFDSSMSYPVLLIAERKQQSLDAPTAVVTKCHAFVGQALEVALSGRSEATSFYSVYHVPQSVFEADTWRVMLPVDYEVRERLNVFAKLESVVTITQGINSGADPVFIREATAISPGEESIYIPLLRDREMRRFSVPREVTRLIFYPFLNNEPIDEEQLKIEFPSTWAYLEANYERLANRSSVQASQVLWWRPERPRSPEKMLRPKIVGPHLMLLPKFAIDHEGRFGVSRAPYMYHSKNDRDILAFVVACLNSTVGHWQLAATSHKYNRGYARLEAKTLREFRIPIPGSVSPVALSTIIKTVDYLCANSDDGEALERLDRLIADVYGIDLSQLSSRPI